MRYEPIAKMIDKTFAFALNRTFSREEAEDLTQEILFQAVKSIDSLLDQSKFEPWYWRLAEITHKVFKRSRGKDRSTMSYDSIIIPSNDDYAFIQEDQYQGLRRQIGSLSASYRDIIIMHYYNNLSCKTISQKLGLPEGTVTYRLSMARTKLKERCSLMTESALKPAELKIRIQGEGNYNGEDKPFPWQYIDDALSQNILFYAYREPQTIEGLSAMTGVPAFYIEDRINNLVKREALIQTSKNKIQTSFLIFDKEINAYPHAHASQFADSVADQFFELSDRLLRQMLSHGLKTANRSRGEIQCLLCVMLLDKFVPEYRPSEYRRFERRYDGGLWEYTGFYNDGSCGGDVGIGIEKSMNNYESQKLAHYAYHFAPFAYRKMMYDHEINVCQAIINKQPLTQAQKETAAKLIAEGYLTKDDSDNIVCAIPLFSKEQYDFYITSAKAIFADFLPLYSQKVKIYLDGYIKLFPKHLTDAAQRNGFYVFVALFKAIAANWLKNGKITLPGGALCDVLITM